MKAAHFDSDEVLRCCKGKLGIQFRQRGECNGWFVLDGLKKCRITVPQGRKPVPPGTLASMARQLRIGVQDFPLLVSCTMSRQQYEDTLRSQRPSGRT